MVNQEINYTIQNACRPEIDGMPATITLIQDSRSAWCSGLNHRRGLVRVVDRNGKVQEWETCWEAAQLKVIA